MLVVHNAIIILLKTHPKIVILVIRSTIMMQKSQITKHLDF